MVYTRHRPTTVFSGHIYLTRCFCTACKLRMVFTSSYIFKWFKTNQKKDNTLWPMKMKWNSKHPWVKLYWDPVLPVCLRALRGCFHAQRASLRTCSKGRVAHKAPGVYYVALYVVELYMVNVLRFSHNQSSWKSVLSTCRWFLTLFNFRFFWFYDSVKVKRVRSKLWFWFWILIFFQAHQMGSNPLSWCRAGQWAIAPSRPHSHQGELLIHWQPSWTQTPILFFPVNRWREMFNILLLNRLCVNWVCPALG